MSSQKQKTYLRGLKAEALAAVWLQLKGYKILARRYKTPVGEIDLIVAKKNLIAFIEVKARQTREQALESLSPKMQERISRAAQYYISHHACDNMDLRFDLVAVSPPFFIQHLDNAWRMAA